MENNVHDFVDDSFDNPKTNQADWEQATRNGLNGRYVEGDEDACETQAKEINSHLEVLISVVA